MNVWALDKDDSIKSALILLQSQLGNRTFVAEPTPCDACAIWLFPPNNPAARAYLHTVGQEKNYYGVHLEFLEADTPFFDALENLKLSALVEVLAVHFDVADIRPLPIS